MVFCRSHKIYYGNCWGAWDDSDIYVLFNTLGAEFIWRNIKDTCIYIILGTDNEIGTKLKFFLMEFMHPFYLT